MLRSLYPAIFSKRPWGCSLLRATCPSPSLRSPPLAPRSIVPAMFQVILSLMTPVWFCVMRNMLLTAGTKSFPLKMGRPRATSHFLAWLPGRDPAGVLQLLACGYSSPFFLVLLLKPAGCTLWRSFRICYRPSLYLMGSCASSFSFLARFASLTDSQEGLGHPLNRVANV